MSVEQNQDAGSAQTKEGSADQGKQSREIDERLKALEAKRDEILSEKRSLLKKFEEQQAKLREYEQRDLESQGKHQELIQQLREENQKLKGDLQARDTVYGGSVVTRELKAAAKAHGCVDPDAL